MSPATRRRLQDTAEVTALVALCSTIVPVAHVAPSGWQAILAGPAWALVAVPVALFIVRPGRRTAAGGAR